MKLFIATLFAFGYVQAAQEYTEEKVNVNPWTGKPGVIRYTKTCEAPEPRFTDGSPRGKRQAKEPKKPNCFFHADDTITPPDCDGFCVANGNAAGKECKALNGTSTKYTCTEKPVFVPLGKFDICDRFPDNFKGDGKPGVWFNTVGSNYGCSSATCCLWFPPIKCADIPLVKYAFLPFEHNGVQHNDCLDQDAAEANSITAAEINEGSNGQRRQVCVFTAELDESGEQIIGEDSNAVVSFKETTVEFSDCEPSHSPAAGCCRFEPIFE